MYVGEALWWSTELSLPLAVRAMAPVGVGGAKASSVGEYVGVPGTLDCSAPNAGTTSGVAGCPVRVGVGGAPQGRRIGVPGCLGGSSGTSVGVPGGVARDTGLGTATGTTDAGELSSARAGEWTAAAAAGAGGGGGGGWKDCLRGRFGGGGTTRRGTASM
mmetsp:Transcript_7475/g.19107  ORF Transcript_7475/g.19107 Transcript_7475/m.19107 type:complete len:160 (-) Transcript_7475:100-579(-)